MLEGNLFKFFVKSFFFCDKMSSDGGGNVIQSVWSRRVTLLSGISLVGVGAVIGAGSVYFFYIRRKLEDIFQIQASLSSQVQSLKREVDNLNESLSLTPSKGNSSINKGANNRVSSFASSKGNSSKPKRTVRFSNGYETADDDEYVTASSSDSEVEYGASPISSRQVSK